MATLVKPKPLLSVRDFSLIAWKAQFLGNAFFGLPLVIVNCLSEGFSLSAVFWVSVLYAAIYLSFFVPLFGALSYFFLKPINVIFDRLRAGQALSFEEAKKALESLLNLPIKYALVVLLSVPPSFLAAAVLLRTGFIPEFMPVIDAVTGITLSLGWVVAIIHAFLVDIFLETYLRPSIAFLVSRYVFRPGELRIIRVSLFGKILLLVLTAVAASQLSVATFLLGKVSMSLPSEFRDALLSVVFVVGLSFSAVFVIALAFARNLSQPLEKIMDWADQVTRGDTKKGIDVMTNDEFSGVAEYLKKMVVELEEAKSLLEIKVAARTRELQELAEGLENQVQERTQELQKRLSELERFNRLTVDRELKMAELKKEIARLKAELASGQKN